MIKRVQCELNDSRVMRKFLEGALEAPSTWAFLPIHREVGKVSSWRGKIKQTKKTFVEEKLDSWMEQIKWAFERQKKKNKKINFKKNDKSS